MRKSGNRAGLIERFMFAALVALGADVPAYQREVNAALAAGASNDAVIATLRRVAPIVGTNRTMSAAPRLALALGYDVDASLESLEAADP